MALSGEKGAPHPEDINDDLARETHFYEQALATANAAIRKLKDLGVATRRPDDFYAEMVKSDEHMKRVRAELIFEQTSLETREERRKAREQKRYGKQVQAEKLKERTLQKKESIKSLDKWRKQRKRSGFADDGKAPEGFEDDAPKKRNARESRGGGGQHGGASQKREFKDDKFGFGGRKRVRPQSPLFFFVDDPSRLFPTRPAREERSLRSSQPAPTKGGCGACCPHAPTPSALGHLLIHGAYPELKRLRVTRAVVGWRRLLTPSREPPASRRSAEHIPLPGGTRRRRHYLSGQTMLMLFDSTFFSVWFRVASFLLARRRRLSSSLFVFSGWNVASRRAHVSGLTPPFASPPRLAAQEAKRQGQRAGHDRLQTLQLRQRVQVRQGLGRTFGACAFPSSDVDVLFFFPLSSLSKGIIGRPTRRASVRRRHRAPRREDQSTPLDLHVRMTPRPVSYY